jgi:hypothetical protein
LARRPPESKFLSMWSKLKLAWSSGWLCLSNWLLSTPYFCCSLNIFLSSLFWSSLLN